MNRIDSWTDLCALAEQLAGDRWIFRGEERLNDKLQPKAGRVGTEKDTARKKPYKLKDEKAALDRFKKSARPYIAHTPASDIEWLSIAQHHGMATRLLDWTESLFVGAFFAVQYAGTRGDARIYGAKNLPKVSAAGEKRPFTCKQLMRFDPPHITPRIPAQRSVFTLQPKPTEDI